jgi:hypothetical protein
MASIFAQPPATVRCQSIDQSISTNSAGFVMLADFPAHAIQVSEEVLVRVPNVPPQPVNPWVACKFGTTCLGTAFGMPDTRTDKDDSAQTWMVHVSQICDGSPAANAQFCHENWARLVLTYDLPRTASTVQCLSQSTFEVESGTSYNVSLYAPAPATTKTMGWSGWMRNEEAGSHWQVCDAKDAGHFCMANGFNFSNVWQAQTDDRDNAQGFSFTCTDMGEVNSNGVGHIIIGPTRWCRAQIGYPFN